MINKKLSNYINWLAVLLAGCTITSVSLAAQNHIYNNSQSTWTITYSVEGPLYAHMSGPGCPSGSNSCKIQPGTVLEVDYSALPPTGNVYVTDSNYVTKEFSFSTFSVHFEYIYHTGDTDAISVNDPDDGDISIWKNDWSPPVKNRKTG